jgi:hypothetical protein
MGGGFSYRNSCSKDGFYRSDDDGRVDRQRITEQEAFQYQTSVGYIVTASIASPRDSVKSKGVNNEVHLLWLSRAPDLTGRDHTHLTADPASTDIDSVAGPAVIWLMILEQMQHVLGAQGGPSQLRIGGVRPSPIGSDLP